MEGVKKSQRYHGRAQEVHRSGQSRRSVGWLAPSIESFQVVQQMFAAGFSSEVIREEADKVTLWAHEDGLRPTFIDTTN